MQVSLFLLRYNRRMLVPVKPDVDIMVIYTDFRNVNMSKNYI